MDTVVLLLRLSKAGRPNDAIRLAASAVLAKVVLCLPVDETTYEILAIRESIKEDLTNRS